MEARSIKSLEEMGAEEKLNQIRRLIRGREVQDPLELLVCIMAVIEPRATLEALRDRSALQMARITP